MTRQQVVAELKVVAGMMARQQWGAAARFERLVRRLTPRQRKDLRETLKQMVEEARAEAGARTKAPTTAPAAQGWRARFATGWTATVLDEDRAAARRRLQQIGRGEAFRMEAVAREAHRVWGRDEDEAEGGEEE